MHENEIKFDGFVRLSRFDLILIKSTNRKIKSCIQIRHVRASIFRCKRVPDVRLATDQKKFTSVILKEVTGFPSDAEIAVFNVLCICLLSAPANRIRDVQKHNTGMTND